MSLSIQNSITNLSTLYRYNNIQKLQSTFTNKSENITKTTNLSVSNVCGVKYGEDPEEVLIEDRAIYESRKYYPSMKNIEFGSEEWNNWKKENCNNFFPPLDAPVAVRRAFREAKESIPKDDIKARQEFASNAAHLTIYQHYPQYCDLQSPFKLETPSDYEALLNFDTKRNLVSAEIDTDNKKYFKKIAFNNKMINKLHKTLFGL